MSNEVRLIGISGGSGSGKTTIIKRIAERVKDFVFIPQDNYYKSAENISNKNITDFNFDHPDAFDTSLLLEHLSELKEGKAIEMPTYDFVHHRRAKEVVQVEPSRVVLVEGIMVFFEQEIRDMMDLKIFVDTPDDIRFIRRLERDVTDRGRTMESVIKQYLEVVRPGHYMFIEPTKEFADIIIPEGGHNANALRVLASFMNDILT
ncbi:MAG: uridine kinase [Spirochaetaceae bacterium]|nr:uridine kinase [Spirochaetaceae bacterium]RKX90093.1 MAG: uridine kinase [Spirochaetota bacterium]